MPTATGPGVRRRWSQRALPARLITFVAVLALGLVLTSGISSSRFTARASADSLTSAFTVPNGPVAVAVTPDGSKLYVVESTGNSVAVVNPATNTVTTTISVGSNPQGIAVTPDGTKAYVANYNSNNVSVINTATNTVITTIGVGTRPSRVAVTPDGTKAYVPNFTANSVSVINTATNTVTATVSVGLNPQGVAVTPDGTKVYVANFAGANVSVISTATNTVATTITDGSGSGPEEIAITPDGSKAYVSNFWLDNVSVINTATNTVTTSISVGSGSAPIPVAITPDGTRVFVGNTSTVSVIATATNTVITTITESSGPSGIAITPDVTKAYVANYSDNTVSVITLNAAPVITTASLPDGVVGDPYNYALTATGEPVPTYSVSVGSLPAGLTLAANGTITGAPTTAGVTTFTVQAGNSSGSNTHTYTLSVASRPPFYWTTSGTATFKAGTFNNLHQEVLADSPWGYYQGDDITSTAATSNVTDSSGNGNTGSYNGVATGPTAYFPLDENTGTAAYGYGSGAKLSLGTNTTWSTVTAKFGASLHLNGTTASYAQTSWPLLDTTRSFTVSAWVKLNATTTNDYVVTQSGTNANAFRLSHSASSKWRFAVSRSDITSATFDTATSNSNATTSWTMVTGVFDATAHTLTLYINGVAQTTTATHTVANSWNGTNPTQLGRSYVNGVTSTPLNGNIDDLRIYQRALNATEVTATMTRSLDGPTGTWTFDDNTLTTTTDESGHGNTMTIPAARGTGPAGSQALRIGAATDYGQTTGNPVYTVASFTVCAWIKPATTTDRTALSESGTTGPGFAVGITAGNWTFAMPQSDGSATVDTSTGAAATTSWTYVCGVYDAGGGTVDVYVNGTAAPTAAHTVTWSATGNLVVGGALVSGAITGYPFTTIDTVTTYPYALGGAQITANQAGTYTTAGIAAQQIGALQGPARPVSSSTSVSYSGYQNTSVANFTATTDLSYELIFRTQTDNGGAIFAMSDVPTGETVNGDRTLYMDNTGNLWWTMNNAAPIGSSNTYNDGLWHHVILTVSATSGSRVWIDNQLVISSSGTAGKSSTTYARWGGSSLGYLANRPKSDYFNGTIDETALYTSVLSTAQIHNLYGAAD